LRRYFADISLHARSANCDARHVHSAARDLWTTRKLAVAIGGSLTLYSKPTVLDVVYGEHPTSYRFFLRLRLGQMSMRQDDVTMKH